MNKITRMAASGAAVVLAAFAFSTSAMAAPITCPAQPTGDYLTFSNITGGTPSCAAWGSGPQPVLPGNTPLLWKNEFNKVEGPGPNPFSSFTGGDALSGPLALVSGLTDHYIAFKFGQGRSSPNWFVWTINGMTSADWAFSGKNALSFVAIYGPRPTTDVPEPASLALVGLGLLGMGFGLRRRRSM